jgi:putative hydrolase of HD superfamily
VVADQVADLAPQVATPIGRVVDEYEAQDSLEARVAKDAAKLECLLQTREDEAQGFRDAASWVAPSAASIRTPSGRRLADACQAVPTHQWWKTFVDSYIRPAPAAEPPPQDD